MKSQTVDHILLQNSVSVTSMRSLAEGYILNCRCESKSQATIDNSTHRLQFSHGFVKSTNCLIIIVTESGIVASKNVLPKRRENMTRGSIREYTEAVRGRYLGAPKKEKSRILDEFTKVIGYHRKAAIRLLHRGNQPKISKRRGRPRQYDTAAAGALRVA